LTGIAQDTSDEINTLRIAQRDEPKKASDGREANVTGTDGIAPVMLKMVEKVENRGDVKFRETEGGGLDVFGLFDKDEQEAERIVATRHGLRTGAFVLAEIGGKKGLEVRRNA
jgi:hypothetical protein